jgi:glycosyltransferase involved in cell wall biosynthesis
MTAALRLIMPSDAFPPRCGGAGWSAHALARAMQTRGCDVTAIVPRTGRGLVRDATLGIATLRPGYREWPLPFVRNYSRHERLWPIVARTIVAAVAGDAARTVIHAQHVRVAPAAVQAAQRLGVPVVITVRDHWPWDYFATGLHADRVPYPRQDWAALASDLPQRLGPLRGVLACAAIPYLLGHLARRRAALRAADAVIAVSEYIAARLAPLVPAERLHRISNFVDLPALDAVIARPATLDARGALLFVGKLERNKGADLLLDIMARLRATAPGQPLPRLIIAGDGALQPVLAAGFARLGIDAHFTGWIDHDEILRLSATCALFLYPSTWGEPLSRTLLEACACGAAILAMPTGGTRDIIRDGHDGALAVTTAGVATRLRQLLDAPAERAALGAAARRTAERRFSEVVVAPRVLELYRQLHDTASRHR